MFTSVFVSIRPNIKLLSSQKQSDLTTTPDKERILGLLANYIGFRYWHSSVPQQDELTQTHEILEGGLPIYLKLLYDSDSVTRYVAVAMLTYFPEHSHDIETAIAVEKDPDVKAKMQKVYAEYRNYNAHNAG